MGLGKWVSLHDLHTRIRPAVVLRQNSRCVLRTFSPIFKSRERPMSKPITQAQQLADFVVRASYHDLSAQTVSRLKEHVLDTLGCAIGALDGTPVRAAHQYVREMGGTPQCTLIGGGRSSV